MSDLSFPEINEAAIAAAPPPSVSPVTEVAAAAGTGLDLRKITLKAVALAQFGDWRKDVADVKEKLRTTVHDFSNQARVDEAKSLQNRLVKKPIAAVRATSKGLRSAMHQLGKDVTAEEDEAVKAYEDAGAPFAAQITEAQASLDAEKEKARKANEERVAKHEAGLATIRGYADQAKGQTSEKIASAIETLEKLTFGEEWEEFRVPAANALCETIEKLRTHLAVTQAAERAAADQARIKAEHAAQQQALEIQARAMLLIGHPAGEIRDALNLLMLTAYPAPVAEVVQAAHDAAVEQLQGMLADAEQREADAAELAALRAAKAAEPAPVIQTPPAEPVAQATEQPEEVGSQVDGCRAPESQPEVCSGHLSQDLASLPAPPISSGSIFQEVAASPSFQRQRAEDAAAADTRPPIATGELCEWLGFTVRSDFIRGLGIEPAPLPANRKAGTFWAQADLGAIRDALVAHLQGLDVKGGAA